MYFPGHRSGTAEPILMVGAAMLAGVIVVLVLGVATHFHPSRGAEDAPARQIVTTTPAPGSPAFPARSAAPAVVCYPFQPC